MKNTVKKTALTVALVSALGVSATANADVISMNWSGWFTMLTSGGAPLQNSDYVYNSHSGYRTEATGTMTFDTSTGSGSGTVVPFNFFDGSSPAEAVGIQFQAIGDGAGGPGTLVLGNMLFNWSGNNGIPVSIVLDAAGMFGAMQQPGFGVGTVISGTGALPASNGIRSGQNVIGPAPVATTGWDTTTVNCTPGGGNTGDCMGEPVSGGLPLLTGATYSSGPLAGQQIGGTPMVAGPFQGYNANFDIMSITITDIQPGEVPVPAAAWLFGSGLLGLVGIARRRKV